MTTPHRCKMKKLSRNLKIPVNVSPFMSRAVFPSQQVLRVLDWLFLTRGQPEHLRSDNGSEFIAFAV